MGGSTNKSSATFYTLLLPSKHYQLMSKIKYLLHGKKRGIHIQVRNKFKGRDTSSNIWIVLY